MDFFFFKLRTQMRSFELEGLKAGLKERGCCAGALGRPGTKQTSATASKEKKNWESVQGYSTRIAKKLGKLLAR